MPTLTADQFFALAVQFQAMANAVEAKRQSLPLDHTESANLRQARQVLTNTSSMLATSSLNAALDELAPHYDAMLSVLRELNSEIAAQREIAKVLAFIDSALALSAAVVTGNPSALLSAITNGAALLS